MIPPKHWPSGGFIAAFWHGKMLTGWLTVADTLRNICASAPIAVVSLSKDGEILANALHALGFQLIRGSSSRGRDAVRQGIQAALERGAAVVLTPDGPRGPKESFKYGSIRLAAQYRSPILFLPSCIAVRGSYAVGTALRFPSLFPLSILSSTM